MSDHLGRMVLTSAATFPDRPFMRSKDGQWQQRSYAEVAADIRSLARHLIDRGIGPGHKVAIFSPNRSEWAIADYAVLATGAASVPLYATSTAEQARLILADSGASFIFVAGSDEAGRVRWDELPELSGGIAFDDDIADLPTLASVLATAPKASDAELDARLAELSTDDLATIIYTSGTTGEPKGVELPHANLIHQLRGITELFEVTEQDRSLCVLPLSHAFERAWSYLVASRGAEIIYVADPRQVAPILAETRPTCMTAVPRLFEKVAEAARAQAGTGLKRRIFDWAIATGFAYQQARAAGEPVSGLGRMKHTIARKLVLDKILTAFGGPKNVVASGGAPLRKETAEFFFAFGVLVCEGYGLTETSPVVTCNSPGAFRFGTVGKPIRDVKIRIGAEGEVLVAGPNIMRGYFGKPEATAEVLRDGWFHTGDVGTIDEDGFLTITDRIKDLIVTSTGKNIAPAPIESLLMSDPFIEQAVVIGDQRSYLTALIEPAFEQLEAWARQAGVAFENREALLRTPRIVSLFNDKVHELTAGLMAHEKVKKFTLMARGFTMESGLLTPTLKVRRKQAQQIMQREIEEMYSQP